MIFLHFFGLGDVLHRFEREQITGFRPLSLDGLMHWLQNMADRHQWDGEAIRQDVMSTWLDQAEDITRWRHWRSAHLARSLGRLAASNTACRLVKTSGVQ